MFARSPHARPNHVLVNEYRPGAGIMPHKLSICRRQQRIDAHPAQDGAAYWPVVCTVSLGSSLCLNLHRSTDGGGRDPTPAWRILQEPRSLLITTESFYTDHFHGIADIDEDVDLTAEGGVVNLSLLGNPEAFASGRNVRNTRTSLTYRDVLGVSMIGKRLGI